MGATFGHFAYAQQASSANYSIQSDSINVSGVRSSSATFIIEDTAGEIATGDSSSSSFNLYAGYQQMQRTFLSVSTAADVTMSPSIAGVSGGTSNGATSLTVITDNNAGYSMAISASTSPALESALDSFADYSPSGGDPDFSFSVGSTASEFGFSPEGADITQEFKDNGSACNTGSSDTADKCWKGLSTSPQTIVSRTSANHPSGTLTTLKFQAEVGPSRNQINPFVSLNLFLCAA